MRFLGLTLALVLAAASAPAASAQQSLTDQWNGMVKCYSENNLMEGVMENKGKSFSEIMTNPGKNIKCFTQCVLNQTGTFRNGACVEDKIAPCIEKSAEMVNKISPKIGEEWKTNAQACLKADYSAGAEECNGVWEMLLCFARNHFEMGKKLLTSGEILKRVQQHVMQYAAKSMLG